MDLQAPTTGYISVGFTRSGGMADSDILIGSQSGDTSTVDWYTTSGYSTPSLAASRQDDVGVGKWTIYTLAGVTTMEVEDVPVPYAAGALAGETVTLAIQVC